MRFGDKVAIVTGSARGIGEAYARALADDGASVVVADLNGSDADRVAAEISGSGGRAIGVTVDVSDPVSVDAMATRAVEAFAGIDFLVNNAAIYGDMKLDSLLRVDLEYYRHFMRVNLDGALHCTRACWRAMRDRGGGAIVNQSSTAAWMAAGYYSLAKAGLNSLTVNLAAELGWANVRVNAIAPGPTDTNATRAVVAEEYREGLVQSLVLKRLGQPDDLVGACRFLLSDDSAWMTGQVIAVDGGQTIRL